MEKIKVITDIDDCVKSSGGIKICGIALGGIDKQYNRGQFYPGVFQFSFELSRRHIYNNNNNNNNNEQKEQNNNNNNNNNNNDIEQVAVLTARAREFKFALAIKQTDKLCESYRRTGIKYGFSQWGIGENDVYYGSVYEWIFQNRKGERKSKNFDILLQRNSSLSKSSTKYIFIGDTGDRDENAAERMIKKHGSNVLLAVFMHVVSLNPFGVSEKIPEDRIYESVPIYYFRTYVGAGMKAYQNNYITREALQNIIDESLQDLEYDHRIPQLPDEHTTPTCCEKSFEDRVRIESRWNDIKSDIQLLEQNTSENDSTLRDTLVKAESKITISLSARDINTDTSIDNATSSDV